MKCFDQAAAQFGWSKRAGRPGSMVDGDWLVGNGCASACYPSNYAPAGVRITLTADTKATVALAGHEIGTRAYTAVAIAASEFLGLPIENVSVLMGDSDLPAVMIAGGSNNAASATNAVAKACEDLRVRMALKAVEAEDGPFKGADPAALKLARCRLVDPAGRFEEWPQAVSRLGHHAKAYVENTPNGLPKASFAEMTKGKPVMLRGGGRKDATAYAFGAHFVEIRVHRRTRELRVARVVSAFAAGTIVNPKAAHSQLMGGAIWGLSSALLEETELDAMTARYVNNNFADYLVPVNADVPDIEIILVPETDGKVNPLGVKGVGEIGIVGMNAAVANAVFHATGKRIRHTPIRAEHLL
jgi:xanthine dehydrogenase YagR molybdenum-binding subunit